VPDFHVNYYTDNRRFRATKRKICSTSFRRRTQETTRRCLSRLANAIACSYAKRQNETGLRNRPRLVRCRLPTSN